MMKLNLCRGVALSFLFASGLLMSGGCETTNYDPLIVKAKLKELEAKIDAAGGGATPATAEVPPDLIERLKKLEAEVKSLKEQNQKLESQISASLRAAEAQAGEALAALGGVLTADPQSGRYVAADLTQTANLNEAIAALGRLGGVTQVSINGPSADAQTFERLAQLSQLEVLTAEQSPVTEAALSALGKLPKLKMLQ
ncbi:MAG: hypothetical protein ACK557_23290, partial [Planctomycetota bacterium]